jgi:two-component system alkaline phosphatase synthesis response regulator PhoP
MPRVSNTKKILIVDDEPSIVLSLEFLMEKAGYIVFTAGDGEAAMEKVRDEKPDLVLLDINLPGRSGYDICQSMRANPEWNDIRIVMVTAKGRDVEREKGFAMGADEYITKPFSTEEVVETVSRLIENE